MTVASFCDDMLILAVFMLVGFFVREIAKPLQKLFLSSSLIGGLVLLILGPQIAGVVNVPESFSSMPKYSLQGTTQGRYLTGGVPPVRFSM